MKDLQRFQDENLTNSYFNKEVLVVCPKCNYKASATVNFEEKLAQLICLECGVNKTVTTQILKAATVHLSANRYF